ncbi:riboflavin synthase [Allopseudospirillum japonicum]|uniref:Riboflavin synthase n=1 Tax=Allopseudospirillum japonicum TaxID=64971 RepID=A0A1H6RWA1_9GAMM|nr:riboflavin synthase subunit alpha [Allopseudospirillum japonicum]SEI60021.1 riboflavin synthase [Allopseudospirillum japonicum]
MFTGIVQGVGEILAIEEKEQLRTHRVRLPASMLAGLTLGASVAHNGCCLTVTHIESDQVDFDLMQETLKVTNLGALQVGDQVNLERAARFGEDIGGHAMSGHIQVCAPVVEILHSPNNCQVWMQVPAPWHEYIFTKGYIGVDGISLTVGALRAQSPTGVEFCVNLIPETLERTLIGQRQVQDLVNIEVDPQTQAIVDTVKRFLQQQASLTT